MNHCRCDHDHDHYPFPAKPGGCDDPFMGDGERPIKVDWVGKIMDVPKRLRVIGVEGDQNARVLPFEVLRCPLDADITTGIVKVVYTNAAGQSGEYIVDDVETNGENMIRFTCTVPAGLCVKTGKVMVGISIIHNSYEWHITPSEFYVGKFGDFGTEITVNDPQYDVINTILLKQQFLENFIGSGNDVDLDYLLEIFELTKLSFSIGDLPDEGDPQTLYIEPVYADPEEDIENVEAEPGLLGYRLFMWIEDDWKLLASSSKLISYNDLQDKPHIPSRLSELENDVGYQTDAIEEIYVNQQLITKINKSINLEEGITEIPLAELDLLFDSI